MKRMLSLACVCALTMTLAACSGGTSASKSGESSSGVSGSAFNVTDSSSSLSGSASNATDHSSESSSGPLPQPGNLHTATLYIGMDGQFEEYPLETEEEITPELLVEEMSRLTGWNLDLADEIFSGKGGITVLFAETSALFAGPPDPQKEEFHVFDAAQLDCTILDSLKKTLQNWAVVPDFGNPDSVDIYFGGPDGGDIILENLGVAISSTEPYQAFPDLT